MHVRTPDGQGFLSGQRLVFYRDNYDWMTFLASPMALLMFARSDSWIQNVHIA